MKDGHIHSPYCPHGSNDSFRNYIERALELGYTEISFTEHAPLPKGFIDPTPLKDSAISLHVLETYLAELEQLKLEYRGQIKINKGLEVDFIEGYEEEITKFLTQYGPYLDDSILSVHLLLHQGSYDCLDYSPDVFGEMINRYHSIEAVYKRYFDTLMLSVQANLGVYKPRRIGHITLISKFQKKFPIKQGFEREMLELLRAIQEQGYSLDYNGAGVAKPLCLEPYPPKWVVKKAIELNIPLIYGSDAHQSKELHQGREAMILKTTS